MSELLLELLSEEIPARMQLRAAEDLKRLVSEGLNGCGLNSGEARAYSTPRRLTLVIESVPITVRDGRVAGVGVGRASSSASLGLATGPDRKPHELASKQLAQFVLPSWELKTPLTVG